MIVLNQTQKTQINPNCKLARSFLDRLLGLLNKNNPRCMQFRTRFGMHTFFMKESIDVIVLDKNLKIVKIACSLKPNRVFLWNPKFDLVLELPEGTIYKSRTKVGDVVKYTL